MYILKELRTLYYLIEAIIAHFFVHVNYGHSNN